MNYAYWLSNIPQIGIRTRNRLLLSAGSAEEIYHLSKESLLKILGVEEKHAVRIIESKGWDYETPFEKMKDRGITFISREEEEFPEKLIHIPDAPYSIYVKGQLPKRERKTVAVVGARMCSAYGHAVAEEIGKQLALHGVEVISGMADGIDSQGHWGALKGNGSTLAVLGCGVDVCYPKVNQVLYDRILQNGGIISEYHPGTQPKPALFPARNRIISGLSDVIVVVEAKTRSGSLITADYALEQGKDIYAVPGRILDPLSAGCNALIRQGAGIIFDVSDFLNELGIGGGKEAVQLKLQKLLLEKDESMVYSCLSLRPKSTEELLKETKLSMPQMADALAGLVLKELITETFQNYYIRQI